jgi:YD repeat-containing protein
MLESARRLETAPSLSIPGAAAACARLVRQWSLASLAAALLLLALGVALATNLTGGRSSVPVATRSHAFSHESLLSLPMAAQGPVSAALGADGQAYRVSRSDGGFRASSPTQHLSTRFIRSGVSVRSGATRVGLSLFAVGYGSTLAPVGHVAASAHANRVVYAHGGLSEWYVNGPLGLEQGFTLARAPVGHAAGPLTLSMVPSGNAHASLTSGGQSVMLSRAGRPVLRYTGLTATDARGHMLRSWLQLDGGRLLLRVDATGARFPLRIDPFIQQGEKLTASGETGKAAFGASVALSSDGNTALIGGYYDNGYVGAAWVFTRSGSTWTQQGPKLTGSGESSGEADFGSSVALSGDGNTAVIGGLTDSGGVGAAWVFTRSGSTWTQQGPKLTGGGESGAGSFGVSVALSSDGNTALIGGSYDSGGVGAAWVFTRSGSTWTQQGPKLTGSGQNEEGAFGLRVALSGDGNTALISGRRNSGGVGGTAWVFTRSGSTWTQQGPKLTGGGQSGGTGFSCVALSGDGNTALIGGPEENGYAGAAWVFTRSGSTWTQQGEKLTGSGEIGEGWFGVSVALSGDGNTAVIGGPYDSGGVGAAWAFTRSGSTWTQQGPKFTGSGQNAADSFASAVAVSSDGNTALIGDDADNGNIGAAWVFTNAEAVGSGQMPLEGGAVTPESMRGGGGLCTRCLMKAIIHTIFGAPVDAEDGNMYHTFNDIYVPGRGLPLVFTRTYNSNAAATNGPLGYGWVDNLSTSLAISASTVVLTEENGAQTTFTLNGSTWTAPPRNIATLTHNADGTWTLVRQAQQTLTFDGAGRLTSLKDLNGYTTSYSYTGGQLTTVTDAAGRTIRLGYSGGHLTTVTDANVTPNRVATFQYDAAGDLTDVIDVNGGHTQFTYDSNHRMLTMKDPNCFATAACVGIQNVYDSQGRVVSQTDELNRTTMFAYAGDPSSAAGGTTTVTDPRGNVTVDTYEYGVKVSETRGYGTPQAGTTTYRYDPVTVEPVSITDANGHTTTMTYDSSGNLLTRTDPLHRATTNTYDALNALLTTTDPLGVTTTMTYDPKGNLVSRSRPLTGTAQTQTTTYSYGDSSHPGDVTAMTDPEGKTRKYTYDTNGDRISTTDPLGDKTTSTYNAIGWLLTTVSPRGNASGANPASFTTTYSYNNFGQVTETVDPLGHKTTSQYGPDQNLIASTDADGHTTTYAYDDADEQTAVHRADGTTLQTTYWPDGTVKEQIDGAGHATLYEYDPLGRVSAVTDPLGRMTRYGYDPAGNRITVTDPEGRVTTTAHDAANEPTSITYSDGKTPNVTGISYDADGQRTGQSDGSGNGSWTWDSLHRLTSVTEGNNGTVKYRYDLRDDPATITYPDGHAVTRGYDAAGRWTSVTDWLNNTTTFSYDLDSNLTTETLPGSTGITDTSTYTPDDTLSAIYDKHGAETLFEANYARDANRQLTGDSSQPSSEGGYGYTTLNQLCYAGTTTGSCSSPPSGATAYHYDSADNLVRMGNTTQTFNAADELTSTTTPSKEGNKEEGGNEEASKEEGKIVNTNVKGKRKHG